MLSQQLQVVVDWAYPFDHSIGALPMFQEFEVSTEEEQEHAISRFELPGLSGTVVCARDVNQ